MERLDWQLMQIEMITNRQLFIPQIFSYFVKTMKISNMIHLLSEISIKHIIENVPNRLQPCSGTYVSTVELDLSF